jgi:serine/threonine protein kinase
MASHLPAGALPAGALIDERFVIESAVGAGGMAVVYRARDLVEDRPAALKLLHGDTRSTFITEHFAREAEILASLRHPHIVSYIAHGRTAAGEAYLAMEWLDGEDLGQRLHRGPLRLSESLRLLTLLADALATAHRHGVVHRDLKPTEVAAKRNAPNIVPNGPRVLST